MRGVQKAEERFFEQFLSSEISKNGAVFFSGCEDVAKYFGDEVRINPEKRGQVEKATALVCGTGSFLVAALNLIADGYPIEDVPKKAKQDASYILWNKRIAELTVDF